MKPEPVKTYQAKDLPEDSALFPKHPGGWRSQPISKRQIARLSDLGATREELEGLTQGEASDMIASRSPK